MNTTTKTLSQEEKDKLVKNAKKFINIFSDVFNINLDNIKPEVYVYDISDDKKEKEPNENIKNTEENKLNTETENEPTLSDILDDKKDSNNTDLPDLLNIFNNVFGDLFEIDSETKQETENKQEKEICKSEKTPDKCYCKINKELKDITSSNNTDINKQNKKQNPVKERLLKEASFDKEKYAMKLKNMICKKIHNILADEKEHKYKIHKQTDKNPAAAEINLKGLPAYIKDNIYILKDVETIIKNYYEFENVFINYETTKNKEFIDLNIYMIL